MYLLSSIFFFFLQEITPNQLQEGRLYGVPLDTFVVTFMSYSYRTCAIFFFFLIDFAGPLVSVLFFQLICAKT